MSSPRLRCKRKKDCVLAWPESCPSWDKWKCPVEPHEAQSPRPRPDYDPRIDYPERFQEGPVIGV